MNHVAHSMPKTAQKKKRRREKNLCSRQKGKTEQDCNRLGADVWHIPQSWSEEIFGAQLPKCLHASFWEEGWTHYMRARWWTMAAKYTDSDHVFWTWFCFHYKANKVVVKRTAELQLSLLCFFFLVCLLCIVTFFLLQRSLTLATNELLHRSYQIYLYRKSTTLYGKAAMLYEHFLKTEFKLPDLLLSHQRKELLAYIIQAAGWALSYLFTFRDNFMFVTKS